MRMITALVVGVSLLMVGACGEATTSNEDTGSTDTGSEVETVLISVEGMT